MSSGRWTNSRCRRIKRARKKARALKREKKNRAKIARIREMKQRENGPRAAWLREVMRRVVPSPQ